MRPPEWQPLKHAAARLGLSGGHLRRLCELGRVPARQRRRDYLPSGQVGWTIRSDFKLPAGGGRRRHIINTGADCRRIRFTVHAPGRVIIDVFRR